MKQRSITRIAICWGAIVFAPLALAEVPVVDITAANPTESKSNVTTSGIDSVSNPTLPVNQRVEILERQLNNLTQMDLLGQINSLQQEIAKLRGQLDVQTHNLQQLSEQMKAQYQDIDTRLTPRPKLARTDTSTAAADTVNTPAAISTTSTASVDSNAATELQEQSAYQAAIDLSKKGDYVRATTAFQNYLNKYPNGKFAANGHFWLGEIYLIQGQPDPAAGEFNIIINSFPTNAKVPDAILKLGQAYYDKGDWKQAKVQFTKVQKQFPNTPAAQGATSRLQKMQQEGKGK